MPRAGYAGRAREARIHFLARPREGVVYTYRMFVFSLYVMPFLLSSAPMLNTATFDSALASLRAARRASGASEPQPTR